MEQPVLIAENIENCTVSLPAENNTEPTEHIEHDKRDSWSSINKAESQSNDSISSGQLSGTVSQPPNHITNLEKGVVGWDSETDPNIPTNFSPLKKWTLVVLVSLTMLAASFTLVALTPALADIHRSLDDQSGDAIKTQVVASISVLGFAVGPLLLNPMSDIYGRKVVISSAGAVSSLCIAACALSPSEDLLILFRFLGGLADSTIYATSTILASDLFLAQSRAAPLAVWNLSLLVGAAFGGVIGATIVDHLGWRWVSWISCIFTATTGLTRALFSCETNHKVLIQRKTRALQKELNQPELRSCYVEDPDKPQPTLTQVVRHSLACSLKTLVTSPVIMFLALPYGFMSGCYILLFNNVPVVIPRVYHWTLSQSGYLYMATLLGEIVAMTVLFLFHDKMVARMIKANNGVYKPKMSLRGGSFFILAGATGILVYGWAAAQKVHWTIPALGLSLFGVGYAGIIVVAPAYCMGAYPDNVAPSLAALNFLRSLGGSFVPMSGFAALDRLGIGWSATVYALILTAMIPIPLLVRVCHTRF